MKADHRKPFHLRPVQDLLPPDYEKRISFCRWVLDSERHSPGFVQNILWTDEAIFTRDGVVNYHNLHIWAHENPHEIRRGKFQQRFSVNVWIGLLGGTICGPHFLPARLNAESFLFFLNNELGDLLDDVPLQARNHSWIQMDGAPPHYGRQIREWLNHNYEDRWIGRLPPLQQHALLVPGVGPTPWPPRSPDLNPLDYWLWGHLKAKVYEVVITTREQLTHRIIDAANELKQEHNLVSRAVQSTIKRCTKCIEVNGQHFEQFL